MCDVRKWANDIEPRVRYWRAKRVAGEAACREISKFDFVEHHLRDDEPYPASVVECHEEQLDCNVCEQRKAAVYRVKIGDAMCDRRWRPLTHLLCSACFAAWHDNRVRKGVWIPRIVREIYEALPLELRRIVASRRNHYAYLHLKERLRNDPEYRDKRKHDNREYERYRRAKAAGEVYVREPYRSPLNEVQAQPSAMSQALAEFFANERKAKAA